MRLLLTALLLLAAARAAAAAAPGGADVPRLREKAQALERLGRREEARELFRRAVDLDPSDAEARKDLMRAFWDARLFSDAKVQAQAVLRLSPGDREAREIEEQAEPMRRRLEAETLHERAAAAYRAGRGDQAVGLYRRMLAVEQAPDAPGLRDLMWVLWRLDRFDEAMDAARALRAQQPGEKDAVSVLESGPRVLLARRRDANCKNADALLASGQLEAAIALLEPLTLQDPKNDRYWRRLVSALRRAGRYESALTAARTLVALNEENAQAWSDVGVLLSVLGRTEEALAAFRRSLELQPGLPSAQLGLARALVAAREFEQALPILRRLAAGSVVARRARPALAAALYWTRRYDEALPVWRRAEADYPDAVDLRYLEGMTLTGLGRVDEAREVMRALYARGGGSGAGAAKAFPWLLDDLTLRGDLEGGARFVEQRLRTLAPADETLALTLADLQLRSGHPERALATVDRLLSVLPQSEPAWMLKATLLFDAGDAAGAAAATERAAALNPHAREVYEMRAQLAERRGDPGSAAAAYRRAAGPAAADPQWRLAAAREDYDAGRRGKAKAQARALLREADGATVLPILLYHGLATTPRDPMLAHPFNHLLSTFEDHIKALRDAGYAPVTVAQAAAWMRAGKPLPPKPVLVTFDDARMDSLQLGDPVLARYGFKATMMAALVNVAYSSPAPAGYASWARLREYQATGRWEVQSHGDLAHNFIVNGSSGSLGLFLINRKWLPAAGRLETEAEWRARLDADYASSRAKIREELGSDPVGYAYPEGAAGQKSDPSNAPDSEPVNRRLVARHFQLAFVQDGSGLNLRAGDPLRVSRIEPPPGWGGAALLRYLSDHRPDVLARETLLAWASSEGDVRRAYALLSQLQAEGVSQPTLLAQEARIRLDDGDPQAAEGLARRAQRIEDTPETGSLLRQTTAQQAPEWAPEYSWLSDSNGRMNWTLTQQLSAPPLGPVTLRAEQRRAEFVQHGQDSVVVVDNAGGAGLDAALGRFHRLSLDALRETLRGAQDETTVEAALESRWPGALSTRVAGAKSLLASASAVAAGVTSRSALASARWLPSDEWTLDARFESAHYSDANDRTTVEASAERQLHVWDRVELRGVYRFTFDEARLFSPLYYSPQSVREHALGPQLAWSLDRALTLTARYLPTWSAERGASSRFVHDAEVAAAARWRDADSLRVAFDYYETATYTSRGASAELAHRF